MVLKNELAIYVTKCDFQYFEKKKINNEKNLLVGFHLDLIKLKRIISLTGASTCKNDQVLKF
jgi:hypothetical protein